MPQLNISQELFERLQKSKHSGQAFGGFIEELLNELEQLKAEKASSQQKDTIHAYNKGKQEQLFVDQKKQIIQLKQQAKIDQTDKMSNK